MFQLTRAIIINQNANTTTRKQEPTSTSRGKTNYRVGPEYQGRDALANGSSSRSKKRQVIELVQRDSKQPKQPIARRGL
jgi:hypothetical protein